MSIDTIDAPNAGGEVETTATKKTKITITATGNPPTFQMRSQFENGGGNQTGSKLNFNQAAGAFTLTFELVDHSGLGLEFYADPTQALWVSSNSTYPTQAGNGGGAITFTPIKNGKLIVDNANHVAADLAFIVRFNSLQANATPPYIYDPTIGNGGTGKTEDDDKDCD